jgi:hypothetical protein
VQDSKAARSFDCLRARSYGRAVRFAVGAVLLLVTGCGGGGDDRCATPRTATPIDPATTGAITGTVTFEGTPPAMGRAPSDRRVREPPLRPRPRPVI